MQNYLGTSREFLKSRGLRETRARVAVISLLLASASPLSVPEMIEQLAQRKQRFDKTTLYRALDFLVTEGVATTALLFDSCQYYELTGEHHHHIVCTCCGDIQDVPAKENIEAVARRLFQEKGFRVDSHSMEFFGLCRTCLS